VETGQVWDEASLIGASWLLYVEMASALARGHRTGHITVTEQDLAWRSFLEDWQETVRLYPVESVLVQGAEMAQTHVLRGYDAVHLASALAWQEILDEPVVVASFDRELAEAALQVGLQAWPEEY
jgi:predicted nucleic acid-binding protein